MTRVENSKIARILCIGGSDSGAGAGIQADVKTITALGGYAMTAITAITAQNTLGVQKIMPISAQMLRAQCVSVVEDIGVDAVKIGMIGSEENALVVADILAELRVENVSLPIVFDPVMVSTSGAQLAEEDVVAAFLPIIKHTTLLTPNLPELEALGGIARLQVLGVTTLVKGGHGGGVVLTDRLYDSHTEVAHWTDNRIETRHTHGTGCTMASAIACGLGQGLPLIEAISRARKIVRRALEYVPDLGKGHGPIGDYSNIVHNL